MTKFKDFTGQKFCRLTVIKRGKAYLSPKGFKQQKWLCKCECGKEIYVLQSALVTGRTKSCGCFYEENIKNIQSIGTNTGRFKGTKIAALTFKIPTNNTSGYKGISWTKNVAKWNAYIHFSGKKMNLGYFENKEDAIQARKEAEEKYFKPIIEEFKEVNHGI